MLAPILKKPIKLRQNSLQYGDWFLVVGNIPFAVLSGIVTNATLSAGSFIWIRSRQKSE